uniref:Phospholipid scramblase n=1 Tax=Leptocylindrus danicus TaxID=163516 RepID=A0A7S2P8Z3_9STRA|mmetsp:Transcript_25712/g.38456  ORF Transcript_25712/g.38456 Transcript_25712/m.38456 type:complete len:250 (+) Transcript_25712:52-801(+)|eukprot:CAMPEP_0116020344 /NCGR_PEP_ID=MMETSP0321-20121206/9741_1 /TAXON_ID=163516 /ORGANISM="Leptocylindrus danicus var. danicus, Strain B650" /LENGTH=249 /DNA_ID=CAMNT_0003491017 /DNA_START=59 /DNA_END=808 /DNA_ORIENTATION=+
MVDANVMDRGSDALKSRVDGVKQMDIRQTRRGWLQECLGCEAKNEFKYYVDGTQVASSLDDADFCCRCFCPALYPFETHVKEEGTGAEILAIDRPFKCAPGACKCCCYQEATMTSGGQDIGMVKEQYWYCLPTFLVMDANENPVYKVHPPSCCGGMCMNCFTEGNPCCGKGCCKVPFRVYPADQDDTDGDAPFVGKILKQPKSLATELFTDANSFLVDFPDSATAAQKGLLMGTTLFLNANYFEGDNSN